MTDLSTQATSMFTHAKNAIMADLTDYMGWVADFSPTFAWSFIRQCTISGTPFPLSPFVARELLKNISQGTETSQPRLILEAGPGTGAMTRHIVKKLGPHDKLVLVEYDKTLCETLQNLFKQQIDQGQVEVHNVPLQEWNSNGRKVDAIVTTIPLNSLSSLDTLQAIFKAFENLAKNNCPISFGEYAGTSTLSKTFSYGAKRAAIHEIVAEKAKFFDDHRTGPSTIVLRNIPPARVIHCMLNKN